MRIRLGINGIGRIGRILWRIAQTTAPDVEIVAANDTADAATIAHLLAYDTVRGRFPARVDADGDALVVGGRRVPLTRHALPEQIDWAARGVDLVIEATGQFTRAAAAAGHLRGGARTVIISTASRDADVSLMMGINEHDYNPARHRVVSNSCCTTYCVAVMASVLHQAYGIRSGGVTATYSCGSRPGPVLDGVFPNLRMARANAVNVVPANLPGIRYALDRVLPDLAGRIAGTALRVPVRAASLADLTVRLRHPAGVAAVNQALWTAATSTLKGYLEVSRAPLVSADVLGSTASCVLDSGLTMATGDLVRVAGWYDNEWGYAHRLIDLVRYLARRNRA
jgi:glyceraldehyde 3-phosphate dehydrogenase